MNTDNSKSLTPCISHGACNCSLCGGIYRNIAFKGGYICEDCVEYLKSQSNGIQNRSNSKY